MIIAGSILAGAGLVGIIGLAVKNTLAQRNGK
jgi:hypothetical protein